MSELHLKNLGYCDGCKYLKDLNTMSRMFRCEIYKINFQHDEAILIASKGQGYFQRPDKCKEEHQAIRDHHAADVRKND